MVLAKHSLFTERLDLQLYHKSLLLYDLKMVKEFLTLNLLGFYFLVTFFFTLSPAIFLYIEVFERNS